MSGTQYGTDPDARAVANAIIRQNSMSRADTAGQITPQAFDIPTSSAQVPTYRTTPMFYGDGTVGNPPAADQIIRALTRLYGSRA